VPIDVTAEATIRRPRSDVAAFVNNLKRVLEAQG
jgi:hypothetical protein